MSPCSTRLLQIAVFFLSNVSAHARTDEFQGTARSGGKVVYIEKHRLELDASGKLLTAKTRYESPDGKPIAELESDFTRSLMVPDHVMRDLRTGGEEGLRREGAALILFDRVKGKDERTRTLTSKDAEQRILVGCQGLNYYVLNNLDSFSGETVVPLRFLIPGKLDYYDFDMREVESPDKNLAEFEIKIRNWFLKLFAPSLRVRYDRATKRIVWYEGISNLLSDSGSNQKVEIEYRYGAPPKAQASPAVDAR